MTVRLAINGFGRIGRLTLRALCESGADDFEVVAINDPASASAKAHLLRRDSVHGTFRFPVETISDDEISIAGQRIAVMSDRDPSNMPWSNLGIDIVLECTGSLASADKASAHIKAGARRVLVSAPSNGADLTVVYGVNHTAIDAHHTIVSNASCTTNCLAPVARVLHETVGIEKGFMTTVHAYTGDQRLLDSHHRDLYRGRAAATSIIPTSTGAASTVGLVLPDLKGRIDGVSVRVPVPNVSMIDFKICASRPTCSETINQAMSDAARSLDLRNVLAVSDEPLVSSDFNHDPASATVALDQTKVIGGDLVRVVAWYDNEWGFANRMVDVARTMARFL